MAKNQKISMLDLFELVDEEIHGERASKASRYKKVE